MHARQGGKAKRPSAPRVQAPQNAQVPGASAVQTVLSNLRHLQRLVALAAGPPSPLACLPRRLRTLGVEHLGLGSQSARDWSLAVLPSSCLAPPCSPPLPG